MILVNILIATSVILLLVTVESILSQRKKLIEKR